MKLLLVSATIQEIQLTLDYLDKNSAGKNFAQYNYKDKIIIPYVTGVGMPACSFALGRYQHMNEIKLLIHAGISGSYSDRLEIGSVVEVINERFADIGAEDKDQSILSVYELGLANPNQAPFANETISKKNNKIQTSLKKCNGLTVSYASGSEKRIGLITSKYDADVESMEGAAVFYASRMWDVPFISVRAISNKVEPRQKENWNIPLALENLNRFLIEFMKEFNPTF